MEAEKAKEKSKRGATYTPFTALTAIRLIVFSFFCLSLMTSHRSVGLLPEPSYFYTVGVALAIGLLVLPVFVYAGGFTKLSRFILLSIIFICLGIISLPGIYALVFLGTWTFYAWVYAPLEGFPALIFPLLCLASLIMLRFSQLLERKLSLQFVQLSAVCFLYVAAFYIWGQASTFAGDYYDESLHIEGKSYHLIIHYGGWLDSPDYARLYECQAGYFLCQLIYQSDSFYYGTLRAATTYLLYDESSGVLRLQYHSGIDETQVSIMYEHPIP
jgi:hypothetical protein